jgi:hypothetical protein
MLEIKKNNLTDQVVSRERVATHGEVYTAQAEINAMLDLAHTEVIRIESKILEPACGHGNFLAEILLRKLAVIKEKYLKSQIEFERNSIIAISSLYGIDILRDNIVHCRKRLLEIFSHEYESIYKDKINQDCIDSIKFILDKNIIWGDALTLETVDHLKPIVFSEWAPAPNGMIKRRDYSFKGLMAHAEIQGLPLFSDLGEEVFIPTPVKEFPLISYYKVANAD